MTWFSKTCFLFLAGEWLVYLRRTGFDLLVDALWQRVGECVPGVLLLHRQHLLAGSIFELGKSHSAVPRSVRGAECGGHQQEDYQLGREGKGAVSVRQITSVHTSLLEGSQASQGDTEYWALRDQAVRKVHLPIDEEPVADGMIRLPAVALS
ncbi:hypothetical protein E2C01_080402 [Portunus trituberculatus]|uniref:Uncharacterized protein n=1 Tax=Portunus trituberculatus TaxID=210409 RepID=A0A5B7IM47_PORTR|nr:hypothetical protein [Portunus trituberculatus]